MIRRPPRSTPSNSSAASDVYKRQDNDPWSAYFAYEIYDRVRLKIGSGPNHSQGRNQVVPVIEVSEKNYDKINALIESNNLDDGVYIFTDQYIYSPRRTIKLDVGQIYLPFLVEVKEGSQPYIVCIGDSLGIKTVEGKYIADEKAYTPICTIEVNKGC